MSADGEVEVQVRAEGADDAADELAEGAEAGASGGGGDGSMVASLGNIGRVLGVIAGLIATLGPILDLIRATTEIVTAFLAPLAVMLLRLFTPVLRTLVKFLPRWFDFIDNNEQLLSSILKFAAFLGWLEAAVFYLSNLGDLLYSLFSGDFDEVMNILTNVGQLVWDAISNGASWIANSLSNIARAIGSAVWSFVQQLPELIGTAIAERLPSVPGTGEGGVVDTVTDAGQQFFGGDGGTTINFSGGLETLVEQAEQNGSIDFF